MFINFWYCAAVARDLGEAPLQVRMLGQDFVLFRDSSRQAIVSMTCASIAAHLWRVA